MPSNRPRRRSGGRRTEHNTGPHTGPHTRRRSRGHGHTAESYREAVIAARRTLPVALVAGLVFGTAACGGSGFEDRTAEVTLHERTITYEVDSCGLDGDTAFVVGRSSGGSVVQAVIGVADEDGTGVPEATGLTIYDDNVTSGAFGTEAWNRRGEAGAAPGEITDASVTGSRIRARGTVITLTDEGTLIDPTAAADDQASATEFTFDARCDALPTDD